MLQLAFQRLACFGGGGGADNQGSVPNPSLSYSVEHVHFLITYTKQQKRELRGTLSFYSRAVTHVAVTAVALLTLAVHVLTLSAAEPMATLVTFC